MPGILPIQSLPKAPKAYLAEARRTESFRPGRVLMPSSFFADHTRLMNEAAQRVEHEKQIKRGIQLYEYRNEYRYDL